MYWYPSLCVDVMVSLLVCLLIWTYNFVQRYTKKCEVSFQYLLNKQLGKFPNNYHNPSISQLVIIYSVFIIAATTTKKRRIDGTTSTYTAICRNYEKLHQGHTGVVIFYNIPVLHYCTISNCFYSFWFFLCVFTCQQIHIFTLYLKCVKIH